MPADLRILPGEAVDVGFGEVTPEPDVELAREVVVELGEKLDVEEEDGGGGELVGDDVEEDFGAVVFVFALRALFGFRGQEAHAEDVGAVAEEGGFPACVWVMLVSCGSCKFWDLEGDTFL